MDQTEEVNYLLPKTCPKELETQIIIDSRYEFCLGNHAINAFYFPSL